MKNTNQVALIVGSSGQDGRLLVEQLQSLEYKVLTINRESMDITQPTSVNKYISDARPNEVYFLAAHHHSSEDECADEGSLFRQSISTNTIATVNFLDAIANHSQSSRLFYASSCLVFPPTENSLQTEDTLLQPENAYGISKSASMAICKHYREKRGIFASVGILYNHESPLRNARYVSRKIAAAAARIAKEGGGELVLGNVDARVDWGYARDYVNAMHRILQTSKPADYVIATGEEHTVGQFADIAFKHVGLDYRDYLVVRPQSLPRKNLTRIGDSSRLRLETGWKPSVSFKELVCLMVDAEIFSMERVC
jgi:GDPmannose 4,6-dehydratase